VGDLPRSRCFVHKDPWKKRDIIVFIGEAQPPIGKYALCRRIIEFAQHLGVERLFTFAAMATPMHPARDSRVFGATTDEELLAELRQLELTILESGHIGGLNGVLLGAGAESGLRGTCLLGELPQVFSQFPFPKASLAVLETFRTIADIDLDTTELAQQAKDMEQQYRHLMTQIEKAIKQQQEQKQQQQQMESEFPSSSEPEEEDRLSPQDREHIEQLFQQAEKDRSRAYELKRELDRLEVFPEYEDRFLDIFKSPE
jgi:proteasome assembly chaperone (PAC2) family protein